MKKKTLVDVNTFFESEDDEFKKAMELEDMLVDIACEFINYRAANDLTQKELAEKLQITQAMVSKVESGEYNPTVRMLFEIAEKLSWNFSLEFKRDIEPPDYYFDELEGEQNKASPVNFPMVNVRELVMKEKK